MSKFAGFEAPPEKPEPSARSWSDRLEILANHYPGEWAKYGPYSAPALNTAESGAEEAAAEVGGKVETKVFEDYLYVRVGGASSNGTKKKATAKKKATKKKATAKKAPTKPAETSEEVDPEAPYGRKKDGTPRKPPGRKPGKTTATESKTEKSTKASPPTGARRVAKRKKVVKPKS